MTFGGVAHGVRRSGGDPRRSADDGASRRVGAAIGTPEKSNANARVAFGASTSGKENAARRRERAAASARGDVRASTERVPLQVCAGPASPFAPRRPAPRPISKILVPLFEPTRAGPTLTPLLFPDAGRERRESTLRGARIVRRPAQSRVDPDQGARRPPRHRGGAPRGDQDPGAVPRVRRSSPRRARRGLRRARRQARRDPRVSPPPHRLRTRGGPDASRRGGVRARGRRGDPTQSHPASRRSPRRPSRLRIRLRTRRRRPLSLPSPPPRPPPRMSTTSPARARRRAALASRTSPPPPPPPPRPASAAVRAAHSRGGSRRGCRRRRRGCRGRLLRRRRGASLAAEKRRSPRPIHLGRGVARGVACAAPGPRGLSTRETTRSPPSSDTSTRWSTDRTSRERHPRELARGRRRRTFPGDISAFARPSRRFARRTAARQRRRRRLC